MHSGYGLFKRYLLLVAGLFFMGLGVALITKSRLGTSPISSVPYVLSMFLPFTIGQFTIGLSILFILLQVLILRRDFLLLDFAQIMVGPVFGLFIDLGMRFFGAVAPGGYGARISVLLAGCLLLGFGIFLQVAAQVIINPGEGVVRALSRKLGIKFGSVKIYFDSLLVLIAAAISLVAFRGIRGLREGTVISALLVGFFVKKIAAWCHRRLPGLSLGEAPAGR
nr:DUF6198 family protein [uncultured Holophaga sp.]